MRNLFLKKYFLCVILLLFAAGCMKIRPESLTSLSEAEENFLKICEEEHKLKPITKLVGKTFWVYLPFEDNIIELKATKKNGSASATTTKANDPKEERYTINFLEGNFVDGNFDIQYDISKSRSKMYVKDYGYSSSYSEKYQTSQRNILTSLNRAFSQVEEIPGDRDFVHSGREHTREQMLKSHIATDKIPDFYVIVISDITNGIETKSTVHSQDLKRAMQDFSFYEEYVKRAVISNPMGDEEIIDDRLGEHVDFKDITWSDFLTEQIAYRITFRYNRSAFAPTLDAKEEILDVIAKTLKAYSFDDFSSVVLRDLAAESVETVPKDQVKEIMAAQKETTQSEDQKGRLIQIKFF